MRALRLISNGVVPSSSEQSPSPRQRSFPLSSRASQGEKMCARRWRGFADPGSVDDFGSSGTASFVVTESSSPGFAVGAATLCVELEAGWHPMLSGRAIAATERKERGIVENSISRLAHFPGSREGGLRAVGVSAPLSFLGRPFFPGMSFPSLSFVAGMGFMALRSEPKVPNGGLFKPRTRNGMGRVVR